MQIVVLAVGKLKERHWREAEEEYRKRLLGYASLSVEEVAAEPDEGSPDAILAKEGRRLLARVRDRDCLVALERTGRRLDSEAFADCLRACADAGCGRWVFVVGGSRGLCEEVLARAQMRLSFSDLTFPHQLARILLLEQIYRAFTIWRGTPYHK